MAKSIAGIFLALALSFSVRAQETFTYRFDWHGFSNFFQATFTVTQEDFNGQFQSPLFFSSMDVTTPLGRHYHQDGDIITMDAGGRMWPAFGLYTVLTDWRDETQILLNGGYDDNFSTAGVIHTIGGNNYWFEYGYWSVTQQVPEPSVAALAILGTGLLLLKRRTR